MNDNYDDQQRSREAARQYFISVAELNQSIVRKFSSSTDGFSIDDVTKAFPKHSEQQVKDALDSAVEDEYFKTETRKDGSIVYIPIIYDEYD